MAVEVGYLNKCISALAAGLESLSNKSDEDLYELRRAGCVREFKLILEQADSLLRDRIGGFLASGEQAADDLNPKDVFRYATKHKLIGSEACERWIKYCENLSGAGGGDSEAFTGETLKLLPSFVKDAKALSEILVSGGTKTRKLDVKIRHKTDIERLIKRHLPGVEVWAYGSRATGGNHDGSDLNLVLRTADLSPVDDGGFSALTDALTESSIPFLVEIRDWARLPQSFHGEIEKEHIVFIG